MLKFIGGLVALLFLSIPAFADDTVTGDKEVIAKTIQGMISYPVEEFYFGNWILSTIDKWPDHTNASPIHGSGPANTFFVLYKSPVETTKGNTSEVKCIKWTVFKNTFTKPNFNGDRTIKMLAAETCQIYTPAGNKKYQFSFKVIKVDEVVQPENSEEL